MRKREFLNLYISGSRTDLSHLYPMKKEHIVAIDIGTSATKGLLCTLKGEICGSESKSYPVYYPAPGMAEQNPEEILDAVLSVIRALIDKNDIGPSSISAVAFGGVMHSIMPVDRDMTPLYRSLNWADSRSIPQSELLKKILDIDDLKRRTGCTIHPLYWLPRLLYFKQEEHDIFAKAARFISIKEYVLFRLFGELAVDRSTASGTGLLNLHTKRWDTDLLRLAGTGEKLLSPVEEPTHLLKGLLPEYAEPTGLSAGTPCVIGGADGPLAHLASAGLSAETLSLTVGSTAAMRRMIPKPKMLETGEAWCYYMAEGRWLLGGVIHDAGAVMKWLSSNVFEERDRKEELFELLNREASQISPGAEGLMFFPFLAGERSPHNNPHSRGAILGLSLVHDRRHIVRALMEGISYRICTLFDMLREGRDMNIVMSGGILGSPVWLQILSNFIGRELLIPAVKESSAYGSFLLALRALGVIESLDGVGEYIKYRRTRVEPDPEVYQYYKETRKRYDEIYEKIFGV
ncbi:MAG TPA: gluconokinase [Spirochaetota bacterium]|nr:gluconokinase [Spirochaetota bacterium]